MKLNDRFRQPMFDGVKAKIDEICFRIGSSDLDPRKVSKKLKYKPDALIRLLRLGEFIGVVTGKGSSYRKCENPRAFSPSLAEVKKGGIRALSRNIKKFSAETQDIFKYYNYFFYPLFESALLEKVLTTGQPAWSTYTRGRAGSLFELLDESPRLAKLFHRQLARLTRSGDKLALGTEAFPKAGRLLDIGGGRGAMAQSLRRRGLRVLVYESPSFRKIVPRAERANFIFGNFLTKGSTLPGLAPGQLFDFALLAWILHDWDDATALGILKKVSSHLPRGGKIYLQEHLRENSRVPGPSTVVDFAMLLHTGGRERTLAEYQALLKRAGFRYERKYEFFAKRSVVIGRRR